MKSPCLSLRHIGEIVGVHASTVSRELRRNRICGRYNYVIYQFPNDIAVIFVIMRKINKWGKDGSLQRRFTG
jgi:IS30 family transposase